jgi:four helix bundle protein
MNRKRLLISFCSSVLDNWGGFYDTAKSADSGQRTADRIMESMKTKTFKDLIVWQKGYRLVLEIYKITKIFPNNEQYGLAQQMRRAAVSIPSNIAEGYGRKHKSEYNQFLRHAYGSLLELQTQFLLSVDLGYTDKSASIESLMDEVGAMLYRMFNPEP